MSLRHSARTRFAIGSLSTSTPSQSKITSSRRGAAVGTRHSLAARRARVRLALGQEGRDDLEQPNPVNRLRQILVAARLGAAAAVAGHRVRGVRNTWSPGALPARAPRRLVGLPPPHL